MQIQNNMDYIAKNVGYPATGRSCAKSIPRETDVRPGCGNSADRNSSSILPTLLA